MASSAADVCVIVHRYYTAVEPSTYGPPTASEEPSSAAAVVCTAVVYCYNNGVCDLFGGYAMEIKLQ